MTTLSLSIDYYKNIYGITCVENHISAILKYLKLPLQATYINSYIDLLVTVEEFIKNKTPYAYFDKLDRLQKTACRLGIAELTSYLVSYDKLVENLMLSISEGYPLLVQVDPGKLPNDSEILPWRNDHFISLYGIEDGFIEALDDVPLRTLKLSQTELNIAYQNEILVFNVLNTFDRSLYIAEAEEQLKQISGFVENADSAAEFISKFTVGPEDIIPFRDAIGIIRISRCRVKEWLKWIKASGLYDFDESLFDELDSLINKLEQLFATIEFSRLRKKINRKAIESVFNDVINSDFKWIGYLNCFIKNK